MIMKQKNAAVNRLVSTTTSCRSRVVLGAWRWARG